MMTGVHLSPQKAGDGAQEVPMVTLIPTATKPMERETRAP